MADGLSGIFETTEPERLATGFQFTEGPLWHPDGFYFFHDLRVNKQFKLTPGKSPETVRTDTHKANGATFDIKGNVIACEMENRRVIRVKPDGTTEVVVDKHDGKRLNSPNDIICASDGTIYFTNPGHRLPFPDRELRSNVIRVAPDGTTTEVGGFESPNGLALSPDERTLYVANTRESMYFAAFELDASGKEAPGRRIFDMSSKEPVGVPDGMKVDIQGNIYCTGAGGVWVFAPDGKKLGVLKFPEMAVNLAFGGPDLRTLFCTAVTSVYTVRTRIAGNPVPWYKVRATH